MTEIADEDLVALNAAADEERAEDGEPHQAGAGKVGACALQDQRRVQHEEERDEVDDAADPHRFPAGLHCRRAGDAGGRKGGDCDRRGDRGQHAPVEDEHVDRHPVQPELLQRRRNEDGEKDVAGRRRQPEAEHEAGEGAHHEQQEGVIAGKPQQVVGETRDDARHGEGADQETAAGEDADQLDEGAAVDLEELADGRKRPARVLRKNLVQHQQQCRRIKRRVALALEVQEHHDQERDDEDVVPASLDRIPDLRQLRARYALQPVTGGVGVHLHEQADVIERGRNDRGDRDLGVADVEELRDHKRRRTHHRRRQHGAGRSAGLDGAGIGGTKAAFLHDRDGHGARGQHVGDNRA